MTELEKWLRRRVHSSPVHCITVLEEAKEKGWAALDVRGAYDKLALSYIKQSNSEAKVYWYRAMKTHNWIWVRYEPIMDVHWEWAREMLEEKDYKLAEQGECPRPKTWYEDGPYINWTEESTFAKTMQNNWFDHTGSVGKRIQKAAGKEIE